MPEKGIDGCYGGNRIPAPRHQRSPEEQLALLDWHPIFTGRCPNCEVPIVQELSIREPWRCGSCGLREGVGRSC
jgi:hypothetical protein